MEEPIRIELPEILNMNTVNTWLIKHPEPTLIDCGELTEDSWIALSKGLNANRLEIKDIRKIIITHAHVDHMGMANRVVQESGAMVYLSEYAFHWAAEVTDLWLTRSELIKNTFLELIAKDSPLIQFFSGGASGFQNMLNMWEPIPEEHTRKFQSSNGIEIGGQQWDAIYAPGHSSTQTVFFEPHSRIMLSADMLLSLAPTPVIEFDPNIPGKRQKGLPKLVESFHKMKSLNISKVFPGHYEAFDNVDETIDNQLKRIESRLEQTRSYIKEGINDYSDLFVKLYPKRFSFPALVMLIGYLDVLEERELIRKEWAENKYVFLNT